MYFGNFCQVRSNRKSQKIWVVRNSKCSTNSYLDGSFDVVHHLDRASLLRWWCWSSRESFSREFSTCRINLRFLPLSALSYSPLFSLVFDIRIGLDPLLACCLILLLQKMFVLCEAEVHSKMPPLSCTSVGPNCII